MAASKTSLTSSPSISSTLPAPAPRYLNVRSEKQRRASMYDENDLSSPSPLFTVYERVSLILVCRGACGLMVALAVVPVAGVRGAELQLRSVLLCSSW